jgi:hypothetical protein
MVDSSTLAEDFERRFGLIIEGCCPDCEKLLMVHGGRAGYCATDGCVSRGGWWSATSAVEGATKRMIGWDRDRFTWRTHR